MKTEIPVSYTHLDVYKRQIFNNTPASLLAGVLFLIFTELEEKYKILCKK